MEKRLASTKFNMMRYERFLKSMKTYMSKASEKGRDIQELALRAIPDSDKEDESDESIHSPSSPTIKGGISKRYSRINTVRAMRTLTE